LTPGGRHFFVAGASSERAQANNAACVDDTNSGLKARTAKQEQGGSRTQALCFARRQATVFKRKML
jgi:hypothetical protein